MNKTGLLLLAVGVTSLVIQNTFYGYVDADGVIHDSLFLPIGSFSLVLSLLVFSVSGARCLLNKYKK
jgi:hypothetical protein